MKKLAGLAAAAAIIAAPLVATPQSATAATARNGVCETGEVCLYYHSDYTGSMVDLAGDVRDYAGITFVSSGDGRGQAVKNNTASVRNKAGSPVTIFYNANYGGVFQRIGAGASANLVTGIKNDNASQIVGDSALKFPLVTTQYKIKNQSGLKWCYASNANCHHDYNAADIMAPTGTRVVSPVNGTVVSATQGTSTSPSRVHIKDGEGRLWFMTHMHNSPGLAVSTGQSVVKGQTIGYVGTWAHAMNTQPHLHIDMLVGYSTRPSCSSAGCASYPFVNIQPVLREAFAGIPAS